MAECFFERQSKFSKVGHGLAYFPMHRTISHSQVKSRKVTGARSKVRLALDAMGRMRVTLIEELLSAVFRPVVEFSPSRGAPYFGAIPFVSMIIVGIGGTSFVSSAPRIPFPVHAGIGASFLATDCQLAQNVALRQRLEESADIDGSNSKHSE